MIVGVPWEFFDLLAHEFHVVMQIEDEAVFKKVSPLWGDRIEGDVVVKVLSGACKEATEILRKRENGRPEIEGEAVLFEDVEFSSELGVLFKKIDLVTGCTERDRGRETT